MGYQNCVIVGSDLFDLKASIIETAFEKLLHMRWYGTCRRWWLFIRAKTKQSSYFPKKNWEQILFLKRQWRI
jgi:hypothetical protein